MKKEHLFVYGTLKRGFYNHYYLEKAEFVGEATTVEKFSLYVKGFIPYVLKSPKVSYIKGEVYLIDEETLQNIDLLEGHPYEYYREKTLVRLIKNNKTLLAWMYFYKPTKEPGILIPDGIYTHKLLKD